MVIFLHRESDPMRHSSCFCERTHPRGSWSRRRERPGSHPIEPEVKPVAGGDEDRNGRASLRSSLARTGSRAVAGPEKAPCFLGF
jgi:hypothetical protein